MKASKKQASDKQLLLTFLEMTTPEYYNSIFKTYLHKNSLKSSVAASSRVIGFSPHLNENALKHVLKQGLNLRTWLK